jgi:glucose-6-phosphate isomerase, archaeal
MSFDPGLAIRWNDDLQRFDYGSDIFGPEPEHRRLDAIRKSLLDPNCDGPDPVYNIVMDIGRKEHFSELQRRMLLFGLVRYSVGRLGREPVRSQGHAHAISPHSGWSAPEIFEIWQGRAIIYAQQFVEDDPGKCIAVEAGPGELIVVPPGWGHYVINPNPTATMTFAACCDRQYGFVYDEVRLRGGMAWFPILDEENEIFWQPNPRYEASCLSRRKARIYPELGLARTLPIYEQFASDPDSMQWVSDPVRFAELWNSFEP